MRQPGAADQQTTPEEQRGRGRRRPRAATFDPRTTERRTQAEQRQRGRKCRVGRAEPPGLIRKQLLDRAIERAPRVNRADADMDQDCTDRYTPAVWRDIGHGTRESSTERGRLDTMNGRKTHGRSFHVFQFLILLER